MRVTSGLFKYVYISATNEVSRESAGWHVSILFITTQGSALCLAQARSLWGPSCRRKSGFGTVKKKKLHAIFNHLRFPGEVAALHTHTALNMARIWFQLQLLLHQAAFNRLKAARAYIAEHLRDPKRKWRSLLWEAFGDYAANSSDLSCFSVHTSPLLYLSRPETTVRFPPCGAMGGGPVELS